MGYIRLRLGPSWRKFHLMPLLYYLKYFVQTAVKWNIRLAWFTVINDMRGEWKYQLRTSRIDDLKSLTITGENLRNGDIYLGSNYFLLEKSFRQIKDTGMKGLVDFGCGKGRVLIVAARFGFTKITGVEFARELCELAEKNVAVNRSRYPRAIFSVLHMDAVDYKVEPDDEVFFFYNPFNHLVLIRVIRNIQASLKTHPRKVHVIYLFPQLKILFEKTGFTEIFHYKKMDTEEISIFTNTGAAS